MKSRKKALSSIFAIVLGVLGLIEWSVNSGIIEGYFPYPIDSVVFYLAPLVISMVVFLLSFEIIPIIAAYLLFFIYESIAGQLLDEQLIYNYGISFLVSFICIWFIKRLLSY